MNYRERCYESYISTHWGYSHSQSEDEARFFAEIAAKRYGRFLPANKSAKIIDVACGSGHFLYFLQKLGYSNTLGIDVSKEQLDAAGGVGVKNLLKADLFEYLPRHPESFDMVVAVDIIEHLYKDEVIAFFDAVYESLKPGGIVFIGVPNVQCLLGGEARYSDFTHEQGFTSSSLSQVMRVGGFSDVRVMGEEPVIHDFRSAVRAVLWRAAKKMLQFYIVTASGTGRGMWKSSRVLEPRMFAVASKSNG
jgi:SAM-dependent methyltransferase